MEDYIILSSTTDFRLTEQVIHYLRKGYKLQGGVATFLTGNHGSACRLYQAMYKEAT